ncbi:nuclear transport factor 2 family protein [Nocardioides dokdonensis]|uniref:nuclear transport factor 2 family protein n=1 Tax=Nocardioides dokdonensis TaxID=450734 RepID=UPI00082AD677|nr:nuclear transport factor 2 family protein [Nocardioides dokdonensis]
MVTPRETPGPAPAPFAADEIREAYAALHRKVAGFAESGDWHGFADLFTPDAEYVEHAYGTFHGREEIRAWSVATMTAFPGSVMTGFPLAWQVVDEERSRLVCEVRNLMPDPGDGTMLEQSNLTIMTYAGDGLFRREEDVYNPLRFLGMSLRWARIAEAHGRLDEQGRAYLARHGSDHGSKPRQ